LGKNCSPTTSATSEVVPVVHICFTESFSFDNQPVSLGMENDSLENSKIGQQEGWDEEEEYNEDDDEDIDMEAQEIARRLGAQLWADISRANAERNAASAAASASKAVSASPSTSIIPTVASPATLTSIHASQNWKKTESIISTMKTILTLVEKDSQAKVALLSAVIPQGPSVLDILYQCTSSRNVPEGIAGPLSQVVLSLVKSEALFGNLKQSNAPAIQLDIGKRKREVFDEGNSINFPSKRPYVPDGDLHHQVVEAVRTINQALGALPLQALDPTLVAPVRLQLHKVFLFAVTSAPVAGPNMHALQEIGGLIQVIGVLSGIQIGHTATEANAPSDIPSIYHLNPGQPDPYVATDIGTAVYPCLLSGCGKTFSRLYSLRAHQRSHSSHRPHRCSLCPASFARNHDLKRHIKLHDRKAWKCQGCQKVFSRRDAIKRHKDGIKKSGMRSGTCVLAEVVEVQLEGAETEAAVREERRAKLWNVIAVNEVAGVATTSGSHKSSGTVDDGAISPDTIVGIQVSVLSLHGLLQTLVGNALGNPLRDPSFMEIDSLDGQATLASVIARVQSQNLQARPSIFEPQESTDQPSLMIQTPDELAPDEISSESRIIQNPPSHPPLSMYGLSEDQTRLLELAIANAASAAQAQAEAEAALEEQEEQENDFDEDPEDSDMEQDKPEGSQPVPVAE